MNAVEKFLSSPAYVILGASVKREKFGNKILRCFMQHNMEVYPVNPHQDIIEGLKNFKIITELPDTVKSISIITPPSVTERIVNEAIAKGIENIWMQPGAESELAYDKCQQVGINVIAGGPCILVALRFKN